MAIDKVSAFEYLLFKLVSWHKEVTKKEQNDISVLKALKLLFFVSAVGTTKNSEETLLDDVFTHFVAMPYGHVESEIYDIIKQGLPNISINNRTTIIPSNFDINQIDGNIRKRIDEAINKLKGINKDLIGYSSFDLVELSHSWYSWQYNYKKTDFSGIKSHNISISDIKSEEKIYQL